MRGSRQPNLRISSASIADVAWIAAACSRFALSIKAIHADLISRLRLAISFFTKIPRGETTYGIRRLCDNRAARQVGHRNAECK